MMGGEHNLHCCYREQLRYALYAKFREPRLFRMVVAGDWDLVPARCRSHPKEASFVHKYPPADTALHRILRPTLLCGSPDDTSTAFDADTLEKMNDMRISAVVALLEAHPQSAIVRDSFGRTPLHWACMNLDTSSSSKSGNAAMLIIQANPDAVPIVDSEQRTALHALVARCNGSIPWDLLSILLEQDPSAVFKSDIVGDTPIEIVQNRCKEIHNAEAVLELLKATAVRIELNASSTTKPSDS
jgi:ankyrin repeat protein